MYFDILMALHCSSVVYTPAKLSFVLLKSPATSNSKIYQNKRHLCQHKYSRMFWLCNVKSRISFPYMPGRQVTANQYCKQGCQNLRISKERLNFKLGVGKQGCSPHTWNLNKWNLNFRNLLLRHINALLEKIFSIKKIYIYLKTIEAKLDVQVNRYSWNEKLSYTI